MRNLFVPLDRHELDQLVELARLERRRPQDQAALLLAQAVKTALGSDPAAPSAQTSEPLVAA